MKNHYIKDFMDSIKLLSYENLGTMDNLRDYFSGGFNPARQESK